MWPCQLPFDVFLLVVTGGEIFDNGDMNHVLPVHISMWEKSKLGLSPYCDAHSCVCACPILYTVCVCVFVFGRWFLRVAVCSQWKAKRKHVHFRALQPGNPEVRTTFLWRCLSCSTDNSSDREQELCVMFLHNSQIKGDRASTSTQHLPAGQVPRSPS